MGRARGEELPIELVEEVEALNAIDDDAAAISPEAARRRAEIEVLVFGVQSALSQGKKSIKEVIEACKLLTVWQRPLGCVVTPAIIFMYCGTLWCCRKNI